mmetsp:Transcript_15770/g.37293  ORF Transcript_15770/g.37293 Transcript_15770/m.37293 type:complete len:234 (-) Transcript_15770:198-899(-)
MNFGPVWDARSRCVLRMRPTTVMMHFFFRRFALLGVVRAKAKARPRVHFLMMASLWRKVVGVIMLDSTGFFRLVVGKPEMDSRTIVHDLARVVRLVALILLEAKTWASVFGRVWMVGRSGIFVTLVSVETKARTRIVAGSVMVGCSSRLLVMLIRIDTKARTGVGRSVMVGVSRCLLVMLISIDTKAWTGVVRSVMVGSGSRFLVMVIRIDPKARPRIAVVSRFLCFRLGFMI